MRIEQYLANRDRYIEQYSQPELLEPVRPLVNWLGQFVGAGLSIHATLNGPMRSAAIMAPSAGVTDVWIHYGDIVMAAATGAGSFQACLEAALLHELGHMGRPDADEAGAWDAAQELWIKANSGLTCSARELLNMKNFCLAFHRLGRCPMPGEWIKLDLPEKKQASKPPVEKQEPWQGLRAGQQITIRIPQRMRRGSFVRGL